VLIFYFNFNAPLVALTRLQHLCDICTRYGHQEQHHMIEKALDVYKNIYMYGTVPQVHAHRLLGATAVRHKRK